MKNELNHPKVFSREQCSLKAQTYCAYQERSQQEVRNKLYEWGMHQQDVEEIIAELISENFLNEERFALVYTMGKFRIKAWGKLKIRQGLRLKGVPEKLIIKSMSAIEENDYLSKLGQLLEKKLRTIPEKDPFKRRYLLTRYAAAKGYESELISEMLINNKLE